jgi:hypothetical protein
LFNISFVSRDSFLYGYWTQYEDVKCIKIYDKEKLVIFDEAAKSCLQTENGSSLLRIN